MQNNKQIKLSSDQLSVLSVELNILENKVELPNNQQNKRYIEKTGWIDYKNMPLNQEGYRCCRYCNKSITCKRRKTFCSAECVNEYLLRSNNRYLRKKVFARDKGVCVLCEIDTKLVAREILKHPIKSEEREKILKNYDISPKRKIKIRMGVWDADHIIPVKNGGGQCGLDNLRTLCIKCHKFITFSRSNKNNLNIL